MAMLAFTLIGSGWLEFYFKLGVFPRIKRAAILIWDAYAIKQGHWFFDREQIVGIFGPFNIPLEEYLFFIVVPFAAIFTLEAVVTVKPHWRKNEFGE
jgi:lycopene cyclase domain-containing protein